MTGNVIRAYSVGGSAPDTGVTTAIRRNPASSQALFSFEKVAHYYNVDRDPEWEAEVQRRLSDLGKLQPNWDSYHAKPISRDATVFALQVLQTLMLGTTPAPQVVPSPTGGVQLEWHIKDIDLEIHIVAPNEMEMWFEDHRTGKELSLDLSNDLSALAGPIDALTTR